MRHNEDRQLRDFEIRQWYYLLCRHYIGRGMASTEASEQAYDDIGMRYCLRKTSIRRSRKDGTQPGGEHNHLMAAVRENLARLKRMIGQLEKEIGNG